MKKRIYYHHTDCGGVVYYAKYLEFLEESRTDLFESKGILIDDLAKKDVLFVIARQEIDYKSPAFYADILDISSSISSVGNVKIEFEHEIKNQSGVIIAKAKTLMVCVNAKIKPQMIPPQVKDALLVKEHL